MIFISIASTSLPVVTTLLFFNIIDRIRRLLAVLSAYLLREAWRKWKSRRKRDNLLRMVMNRRSLQWKKIAWLKWSAAATDVKLKQNHLKRFLHEEDDVSAG